MNYSILNRDELTRDENTYEFEGFQHQNTEVSFTLEAVAGQIVIVPADVSHKFMNLSDGQPKQIDIHVNKEFITHWLED